jgi:hypothetical protein
MNYRKLYTINDIHEMIFYTQIARPSAEAHHCFGSFSSTISHSA